MTKYIITIILLISVPASVAWAESVPIRLKGEDIVISEEKITASGNLEVEYKDIKLKASSIELDPQKWILIATGDVTVIQGENTLRGNKLTLFLKEDFYQLDDVKGEITDRSIKGFIYIRSNTLQRQSTGEISSKGTSFTTCNLSEPHYHIRAGELFIYPQERLYARDVSFYIGNTRIFSLSHYNLLFDYPDRQPVMPEIGNSTEEGFYIKTFYSHYQSKDLYGYITLGLAEKTGVGFGVTEFYNIKGIGPGSTNIYILPSLEEIKGSIGIVQSIIAGDTKLNGTFNRENILYNRWNYSLSASYKGYSLSHQGSVNQTTDISSYSTSLSASEKLGSVNTSISLSNRYYESSGISTELNDYRLSGNTKVGDINAALSIRDRYYKEEGIPAEIGEYRLVLSSRVQNIDVKGEVFTLSYPDITSLSQFGYYYILTKLPELSLSSTIISTPDVSIRGEALIGNYVEIPSNIQAFALRGNIDVSPKVINFLGGNLDSSLRLNGSYYPPQDYITGVKLNMKWGKELIKNLSLNLGYEYTEGWGNSQFNILSESSALPSNYISGNLVSKDDNYSIGISSKFDFMSYVLSPIAINGSWKKDEENKIGLNLSINPYNLSDIIAESTVSWRIDPKWKLDTKWKFSTGAFQFQELKITYDLHCWEANLRYNSTTQTTSISFSLKALPSMGTVGLPQF
jgi:lipopolysaccharide export system protein LptA